MRSREAGDRPDGRAPEIEIFRLDSQKRLRLFVAAGFLFTSLVGSIVLYAGRAESLAGAMALGMSCAALFALLAFFSFGRLVVSHVPSERTLRILVKPWRTSETLVTFTRRPKVRVEEARQQISNPDAPDRPPSYRVRLDGSPRGVTIEQLLPRDSATGLQFALEEAVSAWPEDEGRLDMSSNRRP